MAYKNEYRDRSIIKLYLEGKLTIDEIAEEVGWSRRTVCKVLHEAGIEYKNKKH